MVPTNNYKGGIKRRVLTGVRSGGGGVKEKNITENTVKVYVYGKIHSSLSKPYRGTYTKIYSLKTRKRKNIAPTQ